MKNPEDISQENILFEEFDSFYFFHGSSHNWVMQNFHFHNQYEILLVLGGGATLEIGNRKYEIDDGDLFLLNSEDYHRTSGAKGKNFERYVLQFDPDCFREASLAFRYNFTMFFENRRQDFIHKVNLSDMNLEKYKGLLEKIERNMSNYSGKNVGKGEVASVKLMLSIMELLIFTNDIFIFFAAEKQSGQNSTKVIGKEFGRTITHGVHVGMIKKYIRDNIEKNLYLDIISQSFSISKYYLCRYFKKETGFTLAQYVTNQKVAKAMALLESGYSVMEVANKLSYSSDTHFISVFKKNCGITPKQYAKSKNSNNM